jgi:DNA-binding response OmpR family regulator
MRRPLVLVAEDDPDLRDLVAATLKDAAMDVDVAGDGREALDRIASQKPDLVLLDLMMPVMDGHAVCDALRATEEPPRVVLMTAADHVMTSAAEVGAAGWLAKPFDIDDLLATVRRCLPPQARERAAPRTTARAR